MSENSVILGIHEDILSYLLERHKKDPSLLFTMRKTNRNNRLEEGYWFIGNDTYLQVSFWDGTDAFQKISRIGFFVEKRKQGWVSNVYISCKDEPDLDAPFKALAAELGGFIPRSQHLWRKHFSNLNYLENLESFINEDKKIIDRFLLDNPRIPVGKIEQHKFIENLNKISDLRNQIKM